MTTVKLKIAELRREKGIGQQDLAEVLGVSFQSVSKWETGTTMPDITLLPNIIGTERQINFIKIENTFGTMTT